jgi:Rad3-related DNA helicase
MRFTLSSIHVYHHDRACPFYLTKDSQLDADIILLPYNYIIDSTARKAMNIDLSNSIVIFDEAHNLVSVTSFIDFIRCSSITIE